MNVLRGLLLALAALVATPAHAQEVVVVDGLEGAVRWLKSERWWGKSKHGEQLSVPRALVTGISPRWRENARKIPVAERLE